MVRRPLIVFLDTVPLDVQALIRRSVPAEFDYVAQESWDPEHRRALARRADYLLVWTGELDADVILAAERARMIQVIGQGLDRVDTAAARSCGIIVASSGGANAVAAAEHTILLMLAVLRRLCVLHAQVRAGRWPQFDHCWTSFELHGKRVGIVGLGNVGKRVAERLVGFGCETLYYDLLRPDTVEEQRLRVAYRPLLELLAASDIVTLHLPLTAETRGLIGRDELECMKETAVLINTSRGAIVDEAALVAALKEGRLAGAALDVLAQEPPDRANPLLELDNVVLTPHIAAGTRESLERMVQAALGNVARHHAGLAPQWVWNEVLV